MEGVLRSTIYEMADNWTARRFGDQGPGVGHWVSDDGPTSRRNRPGIGLLSRRGPGDSRIRPISHCGVRAADDCEGDSVGRLRIKATSRICVSALVHTFLLTTLGISPVSICPAQLLFTAN